MTTSTTVPGFDPQVTAVTSTARTGTTVVQDTERGNDKHVSLGSVGEGDGDGCAAVASSMRP
jgi:hypothetical protein